MEANNGLKKILNAYEYVMHDLAQRIGFNIRLGKVQHAGRVDTYQLDAHLSYEIKLEAGVTAKGNIKITNVDQIIVVNKRDGMYLQQEANIEKIDKILNEQVAKFNSKLKALSISWNGGEPIPIEDSGEKLLMESLLEMQKLETMINERVHDVVAKTKQFVDARRDLAEMCQETFAQLKTCFERDNYEYVFLTSLVRFELLEEIRMRHKISVIYNDDVLYRKILLFSKEKRHWFLVGDGRHLEFRKKDQTR